MTASLVSVIVPAFNAARHLTACIQSVLDQDHRPIEVIVVDDGSTDRTPDVIRTFKKVKSLWQTNQGPSAARNAGARAACGDLMAFIDADDLWDPGKTRLQARYLMDHPGIGYVLTHRRFTLEEGVNRPQWLDNKTYAKDHVGFVPSALMVRRSAFDRVGPFDPAWRYGEGADWFARAKDAGVAHAVLPETLLISRVHEDNLTHHTSRMRSHVLKALKASIDRQRRHGR